MDHGSLHHDLYQAVHRGTRGDVAFYARVCEGAESVLELGCGYGRVLGPLAEMGIACTGLDVDAEMLRRAAARTPEAKLVQADMARFELGAVFDRVIVPHSGLWALADDEAIRNTLRCAADHLAPGGRLAFDVWNADDFHDDQKPSDYPTRFDEPLVVVVLDDTAWEVWESTAWDRRSRTLVATYEHRAEDGSRVVRSSVPHHYMLTDTLLAALDEAGFEPELYCDFDGSRWTRGSEHTVVRARRRLERATAV